jgi:hypothetical protein
MIAVLLRCQVEHAARVWTLCSCSVAGSRKALTASGNIIGYQSLRSYELVESVLCWGVQDVLEKEDTGSSMCAKASWGILR